MTLLLSMPEFPVWILMTIPVVLFVVAPFLAYKYYTKSKELKRDLDRAIQEKDNLII